MLVLSETKLKGRGERYFGNVVGRVSGVSSGRAKEGVCIFSTQKLRRFLLSYSPKGSRCVVPSSSGMLLKAKNNKNAEAQLLLQPP